MTSVEIDEAILECQVKLNQINFGGKRDFSVEQLEALADHSKTVKLALKAYTGKKLISQMNFAERLAANKQFDIIMSRVPQLPSFARRF